MDDAEAEEALEAAGDRIVGGPRGTTPLAQLPPLPLGLCPDCDSSYGILRSCGATFAMIEKYRLDWDPNVGIVAWADQDLFDEFACTEMHELGHRWKLHLGRRLHLARTDLDGSSFLGKFLADVTDCDKLETVREAKEVWLTRATLGEFCTGGNLLDEYEIEDGVTEASATEDD